MKCYSFNKDWAVREGIASPFDSINLGGQIEAYRPVILPHDAMIEEERNPLCASANQTGYYPSKSYTYKKEIIVPKEWKNSETFLEFEGVMKSAMVYVNGNFVASHHYGYSQFFVNLAPYLRYGESNTIKVISINEEKSSRWYSGSGIYREVLLWQGGKVYLVPEKIRVTTQSVSGNYAVLNVSAAIKNALGEKRKVKLRCKILDADGEQVAQNENVVTVCDGEVMSSMRITVSKPSLWNTESPCLYRIVAELTDGEAIIDEAEDFFGIRTIGLDAKNGLTINGHTVKLRGACIHHDNGIIGATTLYDAERYRLKKLKDAGFNAIRSAHNPLSKAMLCVCDELGILVMDEFCDMWNEPKNVNDYSTFFANEWKDELTRLVDKDYNHPCVVLYSLGNEIPEIGREQGKSCNRELANYLRSLDGTRYITNCINAFLAAADRMGELASAGQYSAQEETQKPAGEGSEGLNSLIGGAEQKLMDMFAASDLVGDCLEEALCELDVVGYNYLTMRHELENKLHPDRVVVGSETYAPEIPRLWDIVQKNNHVIGDFTWTGYDYIGEAGIGVYHYQEIAGQGAYPDRLAYCGDININGYRRPVSFLREIVYGLRKEPFIAVCRPENEGKKYDKNNWKYYDALDSWTYSGYEGHRMKVVVLSASEDVELFLNGKSLGKKKVGETEPFTAFYFVPYEVGELIAVGYTQGKEDGRSVLRTAGEPVQIKITANREMLAADGMSLALLEIDLLDKNGVCNRQTIRSVKVKVEGAGILAGFGSANPSCEGSYRENQWKTYDGRVLIAVRSGFETGDITITVEVEGVGKGKIVLPVISVKNSLL